MSFLLNTALVSQTLTIHSSRKALRRGDEEMGLPSGQQEGKEQRGFLLAFKERHKFEWKHLCPYFRLGFCCCHTNSCSETWPCVSTAQHCTYMQLSTLSKQSLKTHLKSSFPYRRITVFGFSLAVELPHRTVTLSNILSFVSCLATHLSPTVLTARWPQ